jgi:Xaa-Pro dipeptidase
VAAYRERQDHLAAELSRRGIFALVLEDFEEQRSRSLRYLCGHPMDALLFVFASGKTVLVPWDVNMARDRAHADSVVPYGEFRRSFREAVTTVLRENGLEAAGSRGRIELPGRTPHLRYAELSGALGQAELVCGGDCDRILAGMRTIKDAQEQAALVQAGRITDEIIPLIESFLSAAGSRTEVEAAQTVEREALSRGAEGLGFETLAAGPGRSWGIHPFPAYSGGPFGGPGLSILDFGITVEGYTSDVTLTVARGPLSRTQETMLRLVQDAYDAAVAACRQGGSPQAPARAAEAVFSAAGWSMPHSLGHGIGLDAHEGPLVRAAGDSSDPEMLPGMAFTIEPGLYHHDHGGVRLENDVLMTEGGPRLLTSARIIRL